ncbi:MAG: GntR family transcriptional regulator [Bauldia sp.]|uniref:GntR family transcriptional regulator n=1 Tax=Bauldia sp. TaxID=2575872 RepID=UPI001DD020D8|nr:GntR family transcriptional regulator [Bauldia sp.]MCB1494974.1 GntR family transcriptional regulator [Bauldia sp.]
MESTVDKLDIQVEPLARDTLQQRVYDQVAGLILDGGIAPGQLVTIQSLADSFGVSTMPVREALKRLTAEKALTVVSGRSMGIPPLSLERLNDLRRVRIELEGSAIAWAAGSIGKDALASLDVDLERMDRAIASSSARDFLQANRSFHFGAYKASQSPTLVSLIEIVWLQISPYFNLLRGSGNYVAANANHRRMAEALGRHDPDSAREAMAADINDAYDILATLLG